MICISLYNFVNHVTIVYQDYSSLVSEGEIRVEDKEDRIMSGSNKPSSGQKGGLEPPGPGENPHTDLSRVYSKGEAGNDTGLGPAYL